MKHEFEIACNATEAAGKLLLQFYDSDYTIEDKGPSPMYDRDSNPVTEADYAADTFLKRSLLGEFPDYGWLSEETADSADRLSKERVWVVDPLDGTKEFIERKPMWVVSVALVEDHIPVVGVLYNPLTEEMFTAARGEGAQLNGAPVACSTKKYPAEMVILNSRTETKNGLWKPYSSAFKELKGVGSVAYKLGLTAAKRADVFATFRPKNEWDVCAGHCIVNEAGGALLDLNGNEITYNNKNTLITPGLVAGNAEAVRNTLAVLNAEVAGDAEISA